MTVIVKARILKLMADYDCFPLWEQSESGVENVDPASLPISAGLRDMLDDWAQRYDDTLNRDDPARSGFRTPDAEATFKGDGEVLLQRLRTELKQDYVIIAHG